jgi:hypothetical protein
LATVAGLDEHRVDPGLEFGSGDRGNGGGRLRSRPPAATGQQAACPQSQEHKNGLRPESRPLDYPAGGLCGAWGTKPPREVGADS